MKQDTTLLKSKIDYCDALSRPKNYELKSISNSFDIQILSCKGDRNNQTIRIDFVISHRLIHQKVCIAGSEENGKAYDEIGNEYKLKESQIGNATSELFGGKCTKVPTDIPLKGYFIYRNVLPGTDLLKLAFIKFKYSDFDGGYNENNGELEIKNIKVIW